MTRRTILKGLMALTAYVVLPKSLISSDSELNHKTSVKLLQDALDREIVHGIKFKFNSPVTISDFENLLIKECSFIFEITDPKFNGMHCIKFEDNLKIIVDSCKFDAKNCTVTDTIIYFNSNSNFNIFNNLHLIAPLKTASTGIYFKEKNTSSYGIDIKRIQLPNIEYNKDFKIIPDTAWKVK